MKISILITFLLLLFVEHLIGQNINKIRIIRTQTETCSSDCKDCGKLVFLTNIPELEFVSDWNYIVGDAKEAIVETDLGLKRTYTVDVKAKDILNITVKGPTIVDYNLPVLNLEPSSCQYFEINYINQIKIDKIEIEEGLPRIARSSCDECGKLVFTTYIPELKFVSQKGNIIEVKEDVEEFTSGNKYIYTLLTKADSNQTIIITGPNIENYELLIEGLKPLTFQHFRINWETTPIIPTPPEPLKISSLHLNTVPPGATITIQEIPDFRGFTPYTFEKIEPGTYHITLDKSPKYETIGTEIKIEENKNLEKEIHLTPAPQKKDIVSDPEVIKPIDFEIKKYRRNQFIWLSGAAVTAAAGGYFKYTADQRYNEYLESNSSVEADELKKKVKLYDNMTIGSFSLTAICTVGFTISTVKKGKAKKNYAHIEVNGQGARLTYNF